MPSPDKSLKFSAWPHLHEESFPTAALNTQQSLFLQRQHMAGSNDFHYGAKYHLSGSQHNFCHSGHQPRKGLLTFSCAQGALLPKVFFFPTLLQGFLAEQPYHQQNHLEPFLPSINKARKSSPCRLL